MTGLDLTTEIAASVERVAAFFVPQRMVLWFGPDMETELEVSGGAPDFAAGQKIRITSHIGRKEFSLTTVVMRYEWCRVLEWRFQDQYGIKGLQRWELARSPDGGTLVRMREEFSLPWQSWFPRIWERVVMKRSVTARDRMHLGNLKRIAESAV